jgi:F-type H+-transporting ATPase subunit delta
MSTGAQAYAAAIRAVAEAEGALDAVGTELGAIAQAVSTDAALQRTLSDRQVPLDRRLRVLDGGVMATAHPATRAAVAMLIAAERIGLVDEVATAVAEQAAAERDRSLAEVRVATALTEAQTAALRAALERTVGTSLDLRVVVDPSVVGGVRARIGDTVIDGSVARRIAQLRTHVGS